MKVAILFEESGYIRSEFIRQGHDCVSVDLEPAADKSKYHYTNDVFVFLEHCKRFDLIIASPVCRYMAVAGNRHYAGTEQRENAVALTRLCWEMAKEKADRVCFENPVSVMDCPGASKQVVQPWHFRVAESKATVLHTHNLPPLDLWVTERPEVVHEVVWKMGPSPDRSRLRGHLPWLARPMAEQWGRLA